MDAGGREQAVLHGQPRRAPASAPRGGPGPRGERVDPTAGAAGRRPRRTPRARRTPTARARRRRSRPRARARAARRAPRRAPRIVAAIAAKPASVTRHVASGSSACASKPAETRTSPGANARASGATTCSTSEHRTPRRPTRPAPAGSPCSPRPAPLPDVRRRPGPGIQRRLVDRHEQHLVATRGRCRSSRCRGGRPSRGSAPAPRPSASQRVPRRDRDVVEEAEAHRPRRLGVVARRPVQRRGDRRRAAEQQRRPPRPRRRRACSAASHVPGDAIVSASSAPPPAATNRSIALDVRPADAPRSSSVARRRAATPGASQPEPVARVAAPRSIARDPLGALGVRAGVVLQRGRDATSRTPGGTRATVPAMPEPTAIDVDVAVVGAGGAGLFTALTAAARGRARRARLRHAARPDRELLGAGRDRRRARRRRLARRAPRRHRDAPAAA